MGENDYMLKSVHEEFAKRMEEEDVRQNHRLTSLEKAVEQISAITSSIERLATNMEHMVREQQAQGERLKALESKDGEMWRKVVSYSLSWFCCCLAIRSVPALYTPKSIWGMLRNEYP